MIGMSSDVRTVMALTYHFNEARIILVVPNMKMYILPPSDVTRKSNADF